MHSLTTRYIHILLQTLRKLGYKRSDFLKSLDIPLDFMSSGALRQPLPLIAELWKKGSIYADEPALGLIGGQQISMPDFGIVAHIWMNCRTIEEGINLKCKYNKLINTATISKLKKNNSELTSYTTEISDCDSATERTFVELEFGGVLKIMRTLVDKSDLNSIQLEEVHFKHSPSTNIEKYQEIFDCPVYFQQDENKISIKQGILNLPIYSPDIELKDMLLGRMEKIIKKTLNKNKIDSQVSLMYSESLINKQPLSLVDIAKKLGIHSSTLKRKIKEEGTSFSSIVQDIKVTMAKDMLTDDLISLAQIGYILGYTDSTAFHRAFKKWTKITPEQFRKKIK